MLNLDPNVEVESTVEEQSITVSNDSARFFFQIFIKNFYSNPIGSIVREITSNCFDSHVEAKVNSPVIIRKSYDDETESYNISFTDFGIGMSPERIDKVFKVLFNSTKRLDNQQIGGFGLGSKSCLSYRRYIGNTTKFDNSYFVITTYNNTKYTYQIYSNEDCMPKILLLDESYSAEHNGTEVKVPVLSRDIDKFEREIFRQLYYFENIVYEGFDDFRKITNDYQIIRGKTFLFRGNDYDRDMHVCLGRVAYPIDYSALGISSYDNNIPVAIKLEIGEVNVNASRENLEYNETTIKVIKKKINEVKAELAELLSKQYENVQTLEDYLKVRKNFGSLIFPNGQTVKIDNTVKFRDMVFTKFKYNDIQIPEDAVLFNHFFETKKYGKKKKGRYNSNNFNNTYNTLTTSDNVYYVNGDFNRKIIKQAWLNTQHEMYYVIGKSNLNEENAHSVTNVRSLFGVDKYLDYQNKVLSDDFKTLLNVQDDYMDIVRHYGKDYDQLVVPDSFIEQRKEARGLSKEILDSTIPVRFTAKYYSSIQRVKVEHLTKFNGSIIYGTKDDTDTLRSVYQVYTTLFKNPKVYSSYEYYNNSGFNTKISNGSNGSKGSKGKQEGGIMILTLANNNLKYMQYCKHTINVKDVYWKLFYRKEDMVINHVNSSTLLNKYRSLSDVFRSKDFVKIDSAIGKKINTLNKYVELISGNSDIDYISDHINKFFKRSKTKISNEQREHEKILDEIMGLNNQNRRFLEYIKIYDRDNINDTLIHILKSVLVLK